MNDIEKVLQIAEAEVGYLEKKSNSQLDNKTANAGSANYTKYARDLDNIANFYNGKKNGYAWCDVFVDWCFVKAFGVETAKKLLCQPSKSLGAGCGFSMNYYKNNKQFYTTPKVGDQIFFKQGTTITHTGLVYKVDNTTVYTIEGNTSSKAGVVANGGSVAKKSYSIKSNYIAGYGRPKYTNTAASKPSQNTTTYNHTTFVRELQAVIGARVDGIAGTETLSKTPTLSKSKNRTHKAVKVVQKYLYYLGYTEVGIADGIAGAKFDSAVKRFQRNNACYADGEITARNMTWKKLLKLV